jgi:acetolactate synthase-1/2/3 large subunit
MTKKATEIFADILIDAGIDHVFGMPGGCTPFVFDALLNRKDKIKSVLARHEGTAACMADMYGRVTGKPGVLMGQGAWIGSNGAFGIMEAFMAGSPLLIITDVSDYASLVQYGPYQNMSGDYGSVDLPGVLRAMTKFTTVASNASEFIHGVKLAIKHAVTGRPGPAAVIIRWNVVSEEIDPDYATPKFYPLGGHLAVSPPSIHPDDAQKAADMVIGAEKPVMILGRGIHISRAYDEVVELAELLGIPVATSYMGKSGIAETHDLALGTMGTIGQKAANERIADADVILTVGSCLSPDNTKMMSPDFIRPDLQKIIQIDVEPLNIGWTYPVALGITADARLALSAIAESVRETSPAIDVKKRVAGIKKFKGERGFFQSDMFLSNHEPIVPGRIVREVNDLIQPEDILVLDAGNNRMFFSNLFKSKRKGQVYAAGGVAGMGWGVAAALSAQMLNPKRRVISETGDGCMMMMLHCLEMAKQYELPVTYVVLNNAVLGNVDDFMAPEKKDITRYPESDFAAVAKSVGCVGIPVEKVADLAPALKEAVSSDRAALVDIRTAHTPHFVLMGL